MGVVNLGVDRLKEAPWNPNQMEDAMVAKLRNSVARYGLVENLVVRPLGDNTYEVLSGNQRLRILRELDYTHGPCVVVNVDDTQARLLAQALNHIQGEDDLGLRAELLRQVLENVPETDVLALLPETPNTLKALAGMGQETMAAYLEAWRETQAARLKHLQFQLTASQLEVVDEALARILPQASQARGESPNVRGTALFLLCKFYLERRDHDE